MINLKYNFVLILLLSSSFICSSKIFIHGVSHLCHNPDGRLGRCTSRESCYNNTNCNRTASVYECTNGHGKGPYVCCIFGSKIVFPDDEDTPADDGSITTRNVGAGQGSPPILFPDEDGNYNISARNKTADGDRFGLQPHVLVADVVDLFPKPRVCGRIKLTHKIYNGDEADLGDFPWLVNLEYLTVYNYLQISCAGSIINQRFVLTAAHCVTGDIEDDVGKLVSLRAGDHNTQTDIDCDKSTCLPRFQRFSVIRTIVHEKYYITARHKTFNDIALVKTDRKMIYSESIGPICLPDIRIPMPNLKNFTRLTVAGWGAASDSVMFTYEKRIVNLPYVTNEDCTLKVQPAQMCAGGRDGKDSCSGDSGASLCRLTDQGWLVEGVASYGRKCGTDKPGVYTRVRSFLEWIHANVDEN